MRLHALLAGQLCAYLFASLRPARPIHCWRNKPEHPSSVDSTNTSAARLQLSGRQFRRALFVDLDNKMASNNNNNPVKEEEPQRQSRCLFGFGRIGSNLPQLNGRSTKGNPERPVDFSSRVCLILATSAKRIAGAEIRLCRRRSCQTCIFHTATSAEKGERTSLVNITAPMVSLSRCRELSIRTARGKWSSRVPARRLVEY